MQKTNLSSPEDREPTRTVRVGADPFGVHRNRHLHLCGYEQTGRAQRLQLSLEYVLNGQTSVQQSHCQRVDTRLEALLRAHLE